VVLISTILAFTLAATKPTRVAIIDTGIKKAHLNSLPLCEGVIHSVYNDAFDIYPSNHGTNIAGIISQTTNKNICFIIINAYDGKSGQFDSYNGLVLALELNPDIIHMSYSGEPIIYEEFILLSYFSAKGVKLVAAAGNNSRDLNKACNVYPACYNINIDVIGSRTGDYGNYGKIVDYVTRGDEVTGFGITLSGTSQAAAIYTKDLLNKWEKLHE
jgi:Subtilase family